MGEDLGNINGKINDGILQKTEKQLYDEVQFLLVEKRASHPGRDHRSSASKLATFSHNVKHMFARREPMPAGEIIMFLLKPKDQTKTPKFQRLNGWDVPFDNEPLDIVAWVSLQAALHSKKESKKSKATSENDAQRHVPKHRCSALEDTSDFEKHSLHKVFYLREKQEVTKPVALKRSKTTLTLSNNYRSKLTGTKIVNEGKLLEKRESYQESKSKDDIDVPKHTEDGPTNNANVSSVSKRSKSVPVPPLSVDKTEQASSFRRLLYYARKYGSREDVIYDEGEDEGYGSKTPSAENKDNFNLFDSSVHIRKLNSGSNEEDKTVDNGRKLAKFSYTHQMAKSSLYEESEDEKTKESYENNEAGIKYYKTGYVPEKDNAYIRRMLTRSHTTVGRFESTTLYNIDDLKRSVVLRKISIQNAEEVEPPVKESTPTKVHVPFQERKDIYEPHKTIVRQNSFVQNDRTQYPVNCTSPELKFSQMAQQRPNSKKQARDGKPGSGSRRHPSDSARKIRAPHVELYRSHTSVCMPIGDLLPAVDRSIRNGNNTKSRQTMQSSQSMPDIPASIMTPRKSYEEVLQSSQDYSVGDQSKSIISPPFRSSNKSSNTPVTQSVPENNGKIQHPTHPSLLLDTYTSVSSTPQSDNLVKISSTVPKDGHKKGTATLAVSMSGVDIEIKHGIVDKRTKTIGKVRFSSSPDKDTKKKLRDAFSRFYNRRPYGMEAPNKNWSEELKFMWNM